jgi:hypothetical protein
MHNFTKLVRGQAPQPGAYHNVLRMRRWLVSLDSTYGVKDWQVCFLPVEGPAGTLFAFQGLAGTLLAYQWTGRYVFLPFEDWQVRFFAFRGLAVALPACQESMHIRVHMVCTGAQ